MVFIFFNELHYDNVGTDTAQAFEVAGVAGASLDGYTAVLYDGNSGGVYDTLPLTGTIPNEHVGYGALSFNISLQNGPDGIALVNASGHVLEFLSYEGSFEAVSGAASGMVSTDVGVVETASTAAGTSMQLTGSAHSPAGFTWVAGVPASPGALNAGQSFAQSPPPPPSQPPFNSAACPPRSTVRAALLGHTVLPYTSSQTDVWDALKVLDADPNDAANVTLFYSRMSVDGAQEYNSGRGWTREHIWPQSLGQFDAHANEAPATDLFALRPAKPRCNSMRNNFKYGMVSTVSVDSECLLACDTVVQGGDRLCEPVDEIKGQIARSLFYMDIAYDAFDDTGATGVNASWADLQLSIVGSPDMFVDWHESVASYNSPSTCASIPSASNFQFSTPVSIAIPATSNSHFATSASLSIPSDSTLAIPSAFNNNFPTVCLPT
ncbi:hypothetical protein AB1Y20_015382 [Prymnesium parvum]|uniref:Phospholipase B-like n=1 Tax=Prymnesium parvum TaxID=97485 RepID=A0AB34JWL6_PRYPA